MLVFSKLFRATEATVLAKSTGVCVLSATQGRLTGSAASLAPSPYQPYDRARGPADAHSQTGNGWDNSKCP